MKAVLFLLGAFGEYIAQEVRALVADARIYTYAKSSRSKQEKEYLTERCLYINERSYDPERIKIGSEDIVFCSMWTKNFFHKAKMPFPVYFIHPSLLPAFRGRAAVSAQFFSGVAISGVSIYEDNPIFDSGDIVYSEQVRIEFNDYPEDFLKRCAKAAVKGIERILNKELVREPQDEDLATYAVKIVPESRLIDFNLTALSFYNAVRARSRPFSGAQLHLDGKLVTVWRCSLESWGGVLGSPGEVLSETPYGREYACGEGSIILTEIS